MKKYIFLAVIFLISVIGVKAQFDVAQLSDNTIISDGHTVNFAVTNCGYSDPCNWKFGVTNTSANNIYMKIFVDNLVNTNGDDFQLCFSGVCLNDVTLNAGYPTNAAMIAAGASSSAGNNFWNQNPVGSPAMSWSLRFQAYSDAAATMPIGNPLTVVYNYDDTFSTGDVNADEIKIYQDFNLNKLIVSTNKNLNAIIYNLLGSEVKKVSLSEYDNTIDLMNLTPQIYLVRFETMDGEIITKKVVVQ